MNLYTFPIIRNIDDVRPYIAGRPEFREYVEGWYTVIRYTYMTPDTFNYDGEYGTRVLRECRGLIFSTDTGKIISRPLHKIFNVNQIPETQIDQIKLTSPHTVLEKLDGSMVRAIPSPGGGFRLGTKSGITQTSERAEEYINANPNYIRFIRTCLKAHHTPIFEWCSRKDRVVVDYGKEDTLTLIAVRDTISGTYISCHAHSDYGRYWGIRVILPTHVNGVTDLHSLVSSTRSSTGREGVILRYEDGHMVKIKTDEYVLLHRILDGLRTERDALRVVLDDMVDDLLPLLPPADAERLMEYQREVFKAIDRHEHIVSELFADGVARYTDRRGFSTEFVQNPNEVPPPYAPLLYAMYGGGDPRTALIDLLQRSLSSQARYEKVKWVVEGVKWR